MVVLDHLRFLQRKESDCPQLFCQLSRVSNIGILEDEDDHEDETSPAKSRLVLEHLKRPAVKRLGLAYRHF